MSQKRIKNVVVDAKDLLAGIQALTIFYEDKVTTFSMIKEQYGEQDPATIALLEEVTTLSDILNFFTSLAGGQLKRNGEHFN